MLSVQLLSFDWTLKNLWRCLHFNLTITSLKTQSVSFNKLMTAAAAQNKNFIRNVNIGSCV